MLARREGRDRGVAVGWGNLFNSWRTRLTHPLLSDGGGPAGQRGRPARAERHRAGPGGARHRSAAHGAPLRNPSPRLPHWEIVSWVFTILGFATLVILHEFGHFAVAKAVGMRVERFSLGFGKPLVKIRRGETEYGIGPIPLGGYVKITGMNPYELEAAEAAEGEATATAQAPSAARPAPEPPRTRETAAAATRRGVGTAATNLALDAPQTLSPELKARAYYNQPVWKRIAVILAGPMMNVIAAFVILWAIYAWHGIAVPQTTVAKVFSGTPAAAVLKPGDKVVSIDGKSGSITNFTRQIATHKCAGAQTDGCRAATPATVTFIRNGQTMTAQIRPRYSAADARPLLGFQYGDAIVGQSTGAAAHLAVSDMWHITSVTVSKIGQIFTSSSARKDLHGVVGTSDVLSQSFSFGVAEAFFVLALISLSLAIINLFPFLPLDGGHIFWAVVERVRGRPVPFWIMERASIIGIALVAFIFLVGFTNDIDTLSSGGFRLR